MKKPFSFGLPCEGPREGPCELRFGTYHAAQKSAVKRNSELRERDETTQRLSLTKAQMNETLLHCFGPLIHFAVDSAVPLYSRTCDMLPTCAAEGARLQPSATRNFTDETTRRSHKVKVTHQAISSRPLPRTAPMWKTVEIMRNTATMPQTRKSLIVPPRSTQHRQSIVALHGRGSNGETFGLELLATHLPGHGLLPDVLPETKFMFPTAPKRRAKIYKRKPIHQWFDNWSLESLETPMEKEELQFDGLRESTAVIHDLLPAEIALVGAENVILWGLSQGCAASPVATLLWQEARFAATIGTCGWLPLRGRIQDVVNEHPTADEDDPFASFNDTGEWKPQSATEKAVAYLRDELDLAPHTPSTSHAKVPIFLGHGEEDDRVPIHLAREGNALLADTLGFEVEYREYAGLGHWYSGEMLRDILDLIHTRVGWRVEESLTMTDLSRGSRSADGHNADAAGT